MTSNASSYRTNRVERMIFFILIALSVQGLFNVFLGSSILASWKQILVLIAVCYALFNFKDSYDGIVLMVIPAILFEVIYSYFQLQNLEAPMFSCFFYFSWVPFFIFGRVGLLNDSKIKKNLIFYVIILSTIGLYVQLYSHYLDFLSSDLESIEYHEQHDEAQRMAFVYVASTLVVPTMAGLFVISVILKEAYTRCVIMAFAITLSILPTGSLGAAIMGVSAIIIVSMRSRITHLLIVLAISILFCSLLIAVDSDIIGRQIERITTNDPTSVSNEGRLELWGYALRLISNFSINQHFFGYGVGATFSRDFRQAPLIHGESSWFQAYIEGGFVMLVIRLAPFILAIIAATYRSNRWALVYIVCLLVSCSVAPLFGSYGVQCVLGYVAGLLWSVKAAQRWHKPTLRVIVQNPLNQ